MDPAIIFFGLAVGALVGMTGMGGGALMTPILILIFGVTPVTAVGTDLAYGAITKTVGGWRHWRMGTVDLGLSKWMAVGSIPAAVAGVVCLQILSKGLGSSFDDVVLLAVAAALVLTGIALLVRILLMSHLDEREQHDFAGTRRSKVQAVLVGAIVGAVVGVTSAGSGGLIVVALILVFHMMPRRVVGTDVFHAAVLLWAAALAHLVAGNIDFLLAANILLGSVPGVMIGTRYSARVPVGTLRTILAIVLIGSALGLITKAGGDIPSAILVSIPVMVVAIVVASRVRARRRAMETRAVASIA